MSIQEFVYTANQVHTDYTTSLKDSVFGGVSDMWGAVLTPAKLNDPSFKILFDAEFPAGTLRVDNVTAEVFFTLPYSYNAAGSPFPPAALNACAIGSVSGTPTIVLVGAKGSIKTSTNKGATWTERISGVADDLWAVTFSLGQGFVAVGANGVVLRSSDGVVWGAEPNQGTTGNIYAVNVDRTIYGGPGSRGRESVLFGGSKVSPMRIWSIAI